MQRFATVFEYWRSLEALTPQEAAGVDPHHETVPVFGVTVDQACSLPWENDALQSKPARRGLEWAYVAQCGLHDANTVHRMVLESLKESPEYAEQPSQKTRLFDLGFDAQGYPMAQSFALSLAAWAAGYVVGQDGDVEGLLRGGVLPLKELSAPHGGTAQSGFEGFDVLQAALSELIASKEMELRSEKTPASARWLRELIKTVAQHLSLPDAVFGKHVQCRVKAFQVRPKGTQDSTEGHEGQKDEGEDTLASFFVHDLLRLERASDKSAMGKAVSAFIQGCEDGSADRLDVHDSASNQALGDALHPARMPAGRWPSEHALGFSQQLAVNAAWNSLRNRPGLLAVNGPPGTGKTTMLRDVVAAVVTERAGILARLGDKAFGSKESMRLGDTWVPFYRLNKLLMGHSIVVASSNNGAVENITLELPGVQAVPELVANRRSYYADIASNVIKKDAWGLLAAPLGKSSNRKEFLNAFWWGRDAVAADGAAAQQSGLRSHLKGLSERPAATRSKWEECVDLFQKAQAREKRARAVVAQKADRPQAIASLAAQQANASAAMQQLLEVVEAQKDAIHKLEHALGAKDRAIQVVSHQRALVRMQREERVRNRPGILAWLSTLGRSHRDWWHSIQETETRLSALQAQLDSTQRSRFDDASHRARAMDEVAQLARKATALQSALREARTSLLAEQQLLESDRAELGAAWLDVDLEHEARERQEPWADQEWQQARQALFLAALDVHRAFIENNPRQLMANIGLASDWLSGKPMSGDLAQLALESLCLVVPVVSTTFASVPRMCARLGQESIGWLLVDEAGQALPSHAVGALWRARRAVIVGDPLQLEPVQTLPAALEAKLARLHGVEKQLWPSYASAQSLADRATPIGTWVPSTGGQEVWVGCPLRLHRRCDEPMFSISNTVAYGGQMVQGKMPSDAAMPSSCWIDVQGQSARGHWVEEEGAQLIALLQTLLDKHQVDPRQVALVSPFRDVARHLKLLGKSHGLDGKLTGTIHTAQGKEADVVVLVLGGDPKAPGAKAWAAAKPNLLNVAVSRARKRLYVIGNTSQWQDLPHFGELAAQLSICDMARV